jgi:hypothetical protein
MKPGVEHGHCYTASHIHPDKCIVVSLAMLCVVCNMVMFQLCIHICVVYVIQLCAPEHYM